MRVSDETVEQMARAYDREEASHCGEPSPWDDLDLTDPRDLIWRNERIAAMRCAADVLMREVRDERE